MKHYMPFIAFLLLGVIWGANFIYMKLASELIEPLQVVFVRVFFGFLPIFIYTLLLRRLKFSHLRYSFHFFIISLLGTTFYYYGFVRGTMLLDSGIAGAISGLIPVFAFLFSFIFKEERVSGQKLVGIIFGFLGVFIIAKPFANSLHVSLEGVLYILFGSAVLGSSFVYAKKFIVPLKLHFSALCTYQLGFATLSLALVVNFHNIENITTNTHIFLASILGLGLLGTGLAFIIYYYIIERLGAIQASSATYLPPIVALVIGYFIVGENITFTDLFATMLIFVGVFLVNKKDKIKTI